MQVECPSNQFLQKLHELKAAGRHVWRVDCQQPGMTADGYREAYVLHHIPAAGLRTMAEVFAALDAPKPKQEMLL